MNIPPKVTAEAFAQIRKIGGDDASLRIAVDGGGCSGFQYRIEIDEAKEDDIVISSDKNSVLIDPVSLPFLSDAIVDYKVELIGSRFVIENPNASSSCGCGTSFSI